MFKTALHLHHAFAFAPHRGAQFVALIKENSTAEHRSMPGDYGANAQSTSTIAQTFA